MYGELNEKISVKIPYPAKTAEVRLPTDEEVISYLDSFGKTGKRDDNDRTADLELFKKIRIDKDGEIFDEYEASHIINHLLNQSILSCENSGEEYTVTMKTPFGETIHFMRPPTLKELTNYRTSLVSQSAKTNRNASVKLYNSLQQKTEGYVSEVPTLHKVAVVSEIYLAHSQIDPIEIEPKNV